MGSSPRPSAKPEQPALERSLAQLGKLPAGDGLRAALDQLLEATQDLFAASGAGLMLLSDESVLSVAAATDELGRMLEHCQEQIGEGPCVETLTFDRVVATRDLCADDRWPRLRAAIPTSGVHAVVGIPIRVGGGAVGALNLYCDEPRDWAEPEVTALRAYGRLVERFLVTALEAREREQLAEQLQHALDNRVTIDRAVGVVMARERVDAVAAFNRLRFSARSAQRKIVDAAAELLREVSGGD